MQASASEDSGSQLESLEEREARYGSYARAAFLARENSQRLLAGSTKRLADLASERVEQRVLAESKAWFSAHLAADI